jgi:tetrapyrrole methylase family protein/MazG family protein
MEPFPSNKERTSDAGEAIEGPDATRRFEELVRIIAALRSPNGCPWDREQNHQTLKKYLIEESYETLDAIDEGDPQALCDELGDVLLQIMLHSQIASEEGAFDIGDVISNLSAKMIRRHPHVFGDVAVQNSAEVVQNWDAIKAREREGRQKPPSALDGVPRDLPALSKAMEISKRAVKVGFEWDRIEDVWAKVDEETEELRRAASEGDSTAVEEELGDLLFTLVNVSRWLQADPEDALRRMLNRFASRFHYMEERLAGQGRAMEDVPLSELDRLWTEAKIEIKKKDRVRRTE